MSFTLTLTEKDLHRLGNTKSQNGTERNGGMPINGTKFIFGDTFQLEFLMLRTILDGLGYEYTEGEDFYWLNGKCDIVVYTSYPWGKTMKRN